MQGSLFETTLNNHIMYRESVTSSSIKSIGYSSEGGQLEVEFHRGDIYLYYNVPQRTYAQLMNADSVGSAFNFLIRDGEYSHKKI